MPDQTSAALLAFDYGQRRIGVALGNLVTSTSSALETIHRKPGSKAYLERIDKLVADWQPGLIVLGWPEHEDTPEQLLNEIRKFGNRLKHRYQLPVELVNEAYSSADANERLKSQRQSGRKQAIQKQELDKLAASIILESWFNTRSNETPHARKL